MADPIYMSCIGQLVMAAARDCTVNACCRVVSACEFSVLQMRQFCLFIYPPRSKWASSEKMIFFLLKYASSVSRSQAHLARRCSSVYTTILVGGRIKLIICQIRYELSVTIHEISTSWTKKKTLDGGPNIYIIGLYNHTRQDQNELHLKRWFFFSQNRHQLFQVEI